MERLILDDFVLLPIVYLNKDLHEWEDTDLWYLREDVDCEETYLRISKISIINPSTHKGYTSITVDGEKLVVALPIHKIVSALGGKSKIVNYFKVQDSSSPDQT